VRGVGEVGVEKEGIHAKKEQDKREEKHEGDP